MCLVTEQVKRTHSDFLCPLCHSLLYVSIDGKEEICSNPRCVCFLLGTVFGDPSKKGSPQLYEELEKRKNELITRIEQTDPDLFTRYVYEFRLSLIENLLRNGVLPGIEEFFACNELLILLNSVKPKGKETDVNVFNKIFEDFKNYVAEFNFIEDIENKRYLATTNGKGVYVLKYMQAVRILQRNYGLTSVSGAKLITDGLFKYDHVDSLARKHIRLERGIDFGEYFNQMFSHIWAMKYFMQMFYRVKKQFDYSANTYDIAALLALFFSLPPNEHEKITRTHDTLLKAHYDRNAKGQKQYEDFASEYVDSKEKAPILVRLNDNIMVDRATVLFFIPYLIGLNKEKVSGQTVTGDQRLKAKKQELAAIFENHIRDVTKNAGYSVSPEAIRVNYEYDIIGISVSTKKILLIDAKYRDPSPSAISGVNLIDHELLDEREGLIHEVIRHQERLDYFLNNFNNFKNKIGATGQVKDYDVQAIVVTKYPPLINKYRQVRVLDHDSYVKLLTP